MTESCAELPKHPVQHGAVAAVGGDDRKLEQALGLVEATAEKHPLCGDADSSMPVLL